MTLLGCATEREDMAPVPLELTRPPARRAKAPPPKPPETRPPETKPPEAAAGDSTKPAAPGGTDTPSEAGPAERPPEAEAAVVGPTAPSLDHWFSGSEARKAFDEKRWSDAATAFAAEAERLGNTPERARAELLAAVSTLWASKPREAAPLLEAQIGRLESVEPWVRLMAAEARLRADDAAKALPHLEKLVGVTFPEAERASLLRARALSTLGRTQAAAKAWDAHLKAHRVGSATILEAAKAHQALGAAGQAREAELLRRVIATAPHSARAKRADRRLKALPAKLRRMTTAELMTRLEAQYDGQHHKQALETAHQIKRRVKTGSKRWCQAGTFEVRTLEKAKKRRKAVAAWDALLEVCTKGHSLDVKMVYGAAKRHASSGDRARALKLFDQVEAVAPKHSYVDDAWVRSADLLREMGRHREADKRLIKALRANGDMQEKATWDLFWHHYQAGNTAKAVQYLEDNIAKVTRYQLRLRKGRLVYWLARGRLALGKKQVAIDGFVQVLREYPLTWYAMLAEQRLAVLDPSRLQAVKSELRNGRRNTSIVRDAAETLRSDKLAAGVELLRLGLDRWARAEIRRVAPDGPRGDWLLAYVFDRVGDHSAAYRIARWKRGEYADEYPVGSAEERWRIGNPRPSVWRKAVTAGAKKNGIDEALVWAIMQTESAFRPEVVSFANAVGLMQLIIPTGKAMARREGLDTTINRSALQDPVLNIRLGTHFLGRLASRFEKHPALIAAGYNAGPGRPKNWLKVRGTQELDQFVENIPYRETRRYTKSVVTAWLRYRYLYGGDERPRIALRLPRLD